MHSQTTLRPATDLHTHHGALTDHTQASHRLTHTHLGTHILTAHRPATDLHTQPRYTHTHQTQSIVSHILLCHVLCLFASPSCHSFLWKVSLNPWTMERSVCSLPHGLLSFCGWLVIQCHYSQMPPPELLEETPREGWLPRHQSLLQGGHRKAGFWPWAQESRVACTQPCAHCCPSLLPSALQAPPLQSTDSGTRASALAQQPLHRPGIPSPLLSPTSSQRPCYAGGHTGGGQLMTRAASVNLRPSRACPTPWKRGQLHLVDPHEEHVGQIP